jgi:membrane protease YdiL (CAAX protease family)
VSTSDKFPPLAEPVDERHAGLVDGPAGSLSTATGTPPPVVDTPSEKMGSKLVEVGLAAATWIASIILLLVMSIFFVIPYAFRRIGMNQEALKEFLLTDKTAIFLQILSTIPAHLLTLGIIWAVVTRFGKRPFWSTLGWSWGRNFGFWTSAGLAVGLLALGMLITYKFHGGETQVDKLINSSSAARYTTAFLATFTAPLVEEMVYRGVLYSALQKVIGTTWSVVGVLLLFTLIHVPQYWPNFGVIAVIGILSFSLTVVRAYTGRLLPCFIIHLVFNGISSILIILEPYVPQLNSGDEQKAESFIMLARIARLSLWNV